ncbi:MAG: tRNA (adenosine(37)-N6)-dimethylallyltransferase MiaA [Bacteroidota bacterium]
MRFIILGPTASGKTGLSIALARRLGVSVISADSRQCYKHMDIGTAKPTHDELRLVPHYNISIFDIDEEDTAVHFHQRSKQWEQELLSQHPHVIYAGGSTLYLRGLIAPFNATPDANTEHLKQLEREEEQFGLERLYHRLKQIDPTYLTKMDGMNRARIFRALDVWMQTGKPFSSFHQQHEIQPPADTLVVGLTWPRDLLYERINERVERMITRGLEQEVESILKRGYSPTSQALQTVGYKEVIERIRTDTNQEHMIERIKTNTRRYAKRQLTYFRKWDFIEWIPGSLPAEQQTEIVLSSIAAKQSKQ